MGNIQKIMQNHERYNERDIIVNHMTMLLTNQGIKVNENLLEFFRIKAVERLAVYNKNIRKYNAVVPERMKLIFEGITHALPLLEDLVDYYNNCLTEEQQHQIMVNLCIDELKEPVEDVHGKEVPHINPYTEKPYCDADVYFEDPYVSLFFAKLCDLNEQDRGKAIDMLRFSWTFNLDYMFDFTHIKSSTAALSKQLNPVIDICCALADQGMNYRDNATGEQRDLMEQAYNKLWEAKTLIDKANKL